MYLDRRFAGVLLCFVLSGLAALLYQTAWIREFSFVFGTSSIAVAAVLSAYMGGLAIGAFCAGRWLSRIRRPIFVYGVLEAGIAASALAVPYAIRAATGLCRELLGGHETLPPEGGTAVLAFFVAASFLILMVPTALMGATLPLLARSAVDRDDRLGPRVGLLYGGNTAGAVAGTVLAAFLFLPTLGLRWTIYVGVAVNFLVFLIAALLSRSESSADSDVAKPEVRLAPAARGMLFLLLLSGVTSFIYEVLWTRLLSHILGGSTYSFATMLATFLAGIAIGSAIAGKFAKTVVGAGRGFAVVQLGIAFGSVLAFALLDFLPGWAVAIGAGKGAAPVGNAVLAAAILLPGALFVGATFPFVVRFIAPRGGDAGAASARAYGWSTIGAILGAVGATFLVIPQFGYRGTLILTVALNVALALLAAWRLCPAHRGFRGAVVATGMSVVLLSLLLSPPWRLVTTSILTLGEPAPPSQIRYYGVGRSASVLALEEPGFIRLYTNGLPEAVIGPPGLMDPPGGTWLATLPCLVSPHVEEMLVIGLGAGTSLELIPSTVKRIEVVELEKEVVEANLAVRDLRGRDPLADPRIQVRINDARGALILTDARYDAIVSQPSHPWTAGASHLYTQDFFVQARDHLEPHGIFLQWIGLEWVDAALFRSLLATLHSVFDQVQVYIPYPYSEAFFVASAKPIDWKRGVESLLERAPADALALGITGPEDLLAELAFDQVAVLALVEGAPISTDDRNLLQARSAARLGPDRSTAWSQPLLRKHDSRMRALDGIDTAYLSRKLIDQGDIAGARSLVAHEQDPTQRKLIQAWIDGGARPGFNRQSRTQIVAAYQADLTSEAAQVAWIENTIGSHVRGEPYPEILRQSLTDRARALLDAWVGISRGEWGKGRVLDETLATFVPKDPGYKSALRIRAKWRMDSGDSQLCLEAAGLLTQVLEPRLTDLTARAQALSIGGRPELALNAAGQTLLYLDRRGDRELTPVERSLGPSLFDVIESAPETNANRLRRHLLLDTHRKVFGANRTSRVRNH